MSGRVLYFVQERRGKFNIMLKHQYETFEKRQEERQGFVLLECL